MEINFYGCEVYRVARCQFNVSDSRNSTKKYAFRIPKHVSELTVGDVVVVDTQYGLQLASVAEITSWDPSNKNIQLKDVVAKVDLVPWKAFKQREKQIALIEARREKQIALIEAKREKRIAIVEAKLEKRLQNAQKELLWKQMAESDSTMKALLQQLEELKQ